MLRTLDPTSRRNKMMRNSTDDKGNQSKEVQCYICEGFGNIRT